MGLLIKVLRKIRRLDDPLVRDFTSRAEEEMVSIANDKYDGDDLFARYVTDPIGRWLDKQGYLEILFGLEKYQAGVIDCYNYSAQNIRTICKQARHFDSLYGQTVAHNTNQAEDVSFLIKNLAECIDVSSKHYSPDEPISQRLLGFSSKEFNHVRVAEVQGRALQRKENDLKQIEISEDDVVNFCFDSDNVNLFEDYNSYIFDQEMDWGVLDIIYLTTGTVIYKGVEMTVDELIGILTKEGYSEKLVREQVDKIISSVISAQSTAQTVMKDHDTAKKIVESLIKDYLGDKDKKGPFKDFVEAMGGITAVKQLAETCPEVLDYLFSDYSKGLEILDNISETCNRSGSPEMRSAIEKLRQDYNKKWSGLLRKTQDFSVDMISKLSEEGIKEWIKDNIGDTSVLMSILDIADMESKVDASHKLLALRKVADELQDAYEDVIEKIRSGNYTEADITSAENLFNMLKETTKSVYKTYRDMCDDATKKIWINDQIENLERMTMRSYSPYTYEAYRGY